VASAALLQGCLGTQSWMGFVLTALLASMAGLAGCRGAQSTRESCCNDAGRISVCECPPMTKCNYWLNSTANDDGTCSPRHLFDAGVSADALPSPPDVATDAGSDAGPIADASVDGPRDLAGDAYPCCSGGQVGTCYCPPGVACNYAPFQTCSDGTCYYVVSGIDADGGNMCRVDGGGD
jgi:hypothetical protein